MSARMKKHHTKNETSIPITLIVGKDKRTSYIPEKNRDKLEAFLEKYAEPEDHPVEWKVLANERIEKRKRAGLVLRGMRYRENCTQKELAKKSKVSQDNISKIENGKRPVGEKVAKRLAKALRFDYKLLTNP
ncbi:MAG: hypothetical protein K940chlam7_00261 [Chlamydiae bacterium]|nr:hypothetical protein [Chlamydiota bacterium]